MPRRAAAITQADVSRVIRAMRQTGLTVVRVVVRPDGVAIETDAAPALYGEPMKPAAEEVIKL